MIFEARYAFSIEPDSRRCKCGVLSSFALMERGASGGVGGVERIKGVESGGAFSDWLVLVLVVCGSVVFVGVVLLIFVVAVCCRSRSASSNLL